MNKFLLLAIAATSAVTLAAAPSPASAQSRTTCIEPENGGRQICGSVVPDIVCIESARNNRVICGRRSYDNRNRDRYEDRDRYEERNRYPNGNNDQAVIDGFDENFYRLAYPDVDQAIVQRRVKNAYDHYIKIGRYEGRFPKFNEASYLSKNPDVAAAIRQRQFRDGYDHWYKHGRFERRPL